MAKIEENRDGYQYLFDIQNWLKWQEIFEVNAYVNERLDAWETVISKAEISLKDLWKKSVVCIIQSLSSISIVRL